MTSYVNTTFWRRLLARVTVVLLGRRCLICRTRFRGSLCPSHEFSVTIASYTTSGHTLQPYDTLVMFDVGGAYEKYD